MKDPAELLSLFILNLALRNADAVDALLAELVNVALKARRRVLAHEALQDAQVTLVVDRSA